MLRAALPALLLGALLAGCAAPRQSDAAPVIDSVFDPVAPLVDPSIPPPLPRLPKPARRGTVATRVDAEGDRVPADWSLDEMLSGVLHRSWREHPEHLTVRMLAWQINIDERPLLVESAILWVHFHEPDQPEFWRLYSVYRHPRETRSFLQGWHLANRGSPHSPWVGSATFEERPDNAAVIRFLSASGWNEAQVDLFTLIDAEIDAEAWKRATGQPPGFAYP